MIFFAYSKEDEAAICEDATGKKPSPFEMFLECILKTGFKVTAIWPVRMNRVTKDVRSVRTLVVFRKETELQVLSLGKDEELEVVNLENEDVVFPIYVTCNFLYLPREGRFPE